MRAPGWLRRRREPRATRQLPLLIWLMLLWVLLWDDLSLGNLVNGLIAALLVTRLLHLPPVRLAGRFNLYWAAVFIGHFAVDLVRASWQIARNAFRRSYRPRNAVIAVSLHTSSDLLMTVTGQALSLIPGSLIVEVDRRNATLYIHVIDVDSEADLEAARRHVLRIEQRLIRALGSRDECAAVADRAADRATREERL